MPRLTPDQTITATGIRIVGRAAADLVATAQAAAPLTPEPNDVLWAARFRVRPRIGSGSPVPALLSFLSERLVAEWDACPPLTRDTPVSRPAGRFHGMTWDVFGEAGAWMGELVWRHRHPVLAGTPCTTHIVIEEQQQHTMLTLCVAADGGLTGVRGMVGAGQSRPLLLDALRQEVALTCDGHDGSPVVLTELDVEPFVRNVMLSEAREWPVAVLAPLEAGGYVVPPAELAAELFGLAPLYVLERHACTFRLTDALGDKRLSAYWGVLRVYRPGFSCADRGEDHPLLMRDRLDDPVLRAELIGKLGYQAADRLVPFEGVRERRAALARRLAPKPAAVPAANVAQPVADAPPPAPQVATNSGTPAPTESRTVAAFDPGVTAALAALPASLESLTAHLRDLSGTIAHLVATNAALADEIARLRTTTAIRATSTNAMERRLGAIETLLRPAKPGRDEEEGGETVAAADDDDTRPTLLDIVRHAGTEHGEALLILEAAERAAAESPYEQVERVEAVLQAMADVARRRQEGKLGTGLRAAFSEHGIDYRSGIASSTSDKLRQQYLVTGPDGRQYDCHEHIALGSSYDPRHCLRIYFTSRASWEPRFVIGHVGRHFEVLSSS